MVDSAAEFDSARQGLAGLDALLNNPLRLGICVLLAEADEMNFSRLSGLLDATDGNLGAQLRKLEDAGYVSVHKEFVDRKPVSWYELTPAGDEALRAHLAAMEAVVRSVGGGKGE